MPDTPEPTDPADPPGQVPEPAAAQAEAPQAPVPEAVQPAAPQDPAPDAARSAAPESLEAPAALAEAPRQESASRTEMAPAEVGARLGELFPALFTPGQPRPIKLRIQQDIHARAPQVFTRKALSIFFHRYTTSTAYLRALASATERFDLDGAPAGELAAEHREAAATELARRKELHDARRAAEREARRQAEAAQRRQAPPQAPPQAPAKDGGDRPPRAPRPDRNAGPRRDGPARPRPEGAARPPRRDRPPPRPERRERPPPAAQAAPEAAPPLPTDEGQRERAMLLRAWESSPLTKANFLVLKRMSEADFDARIAQAIAERGQRGPARAKPSA